MVFSPEDKVIIKHYYKDKLLTPYQIWKDSLKNPELNWDKTSVKRLCNRLDTYGTTDRRPGSGRLRTATTDENQEDVDELICSQEEPGSHTRPQTIADDLGVSYTSVQRMVKRSKINNFKRVQTPQMDDGARGRRVNRAVGLSKKFGKNPRMIERAVFKDESDFPLQIQMNKQNNRVYSKGKKSDIPVENLCHEGNRQSKKVMVSAALTWHGATKPFFVNSGGIKVNGPNYLQHLKKELFPAVRKVYPREDWIFIQDGAPSHRSNLVQDFLQENMHRRHVSKEEWPPKSLDSNPLDFYFWNKVKREVYKGRHNKPFATEKEMQQRIKSVWSKCANNKCEIRKAMKQFVPRLKAVEEKKGFSIKTVFG